MRLNDEQKSLVRKWVAENKQTDEINKLAAQSAIPFAVSRAQVDYYREEAKIHLKEVKKKQKESVLDQGFALKENRIAELNRLARKIMRDLKQGKLWTVTRVYESKFGEQFKVEQFNSAEVDQFRGILDDIARELGERSANINLKPDGHIVVEFVRGGK